MVGLQAVAYGMGGGLLQKVNRDTMQFATKLSHIVYADGSVREVAKMPKTDPAKVSTGRRRRRVDNVCHALGHDSCT